MKGQKEGKMIEDEIIIDDEKIKIKVDQLLKTNKIKIPDAQDMLHTILAATKLKDKSKEKESIDNFLKILEDNEVSVKDAVKVLLPFADPTYDSTFKMLFAHNEHKNILISFLNSLLGFEGDKAIVSLDIIDPYLGQEFVSGIQSTIDVRCKTSSGEDISIEMQRKNKDYFVPRTQDYMAKLLSTQVKEGEGQQYHIKLSDTYILVLAKQNLFVGDYKLAGDSNACYEKTFTPTCKELGNQEMPGNKMHWKFFELNRFKTFTKNKTIDDSHLLKEQWLDFLINCDSHLDIPNKINTIIQEGYKIMKMANWNSDQINKYYKLKANEYDEQITKENELKQAEFKGKWKGEYKGEIGKIKMGIEAKWEDEKILKKLNHAKDKFSDFKEYFQKNPNQMEIDDNESVIMGDMNIEYQTDFH